MASQSNTSIRFNWDNFWPYHSQAIFKDAQAKVRIQSPTRQQGFFGGPDRRAEKSPLLARR
jgi:hypothetical protein